jgi:magnesium-transporting ATPase (P-type)
MGFLMFLGTYTDLFYSSVSPWTTLGPLALVVSISLAQEGVADMARHRSDHETNNHPCVVVKRSQDTASGVSRDPNILEGKSVEVNLVRRQLRRAPPTRENTSRKRIPPTTTTSQEDVQSLITKSAEVEFVHVKRMAMRSGEIVLVKNREMIPADIILLASSGENGAAYIETSPIDGETNLKLRSSPHLPPIAIDISTPRDILSEEDDYTHPKFECITGAVKRVTRMSLLGFPDGNNALLNPLNPIQVENLDMPKEELAKKSSLTRIRSAFSGSQRFESFKEQVDSSTDYVATLTSESPNASVNTFSGKITLPPPVSGQGSMDIPLGAENILLRGAMLRNTEWVIGVACFTGEDTKLARNSTRTPSKFSRLDVLMNRTVLLILFIMMVVVSILALFSVWSHEREFETLWYAAFNVEGTKWPYLKDMDAPEWKTETPNFLAFMFTYITLLNNFVPLSLYITVEMTTLFMMKLIGWDRSMYHKETDTPAKARSTTGKNKCIE